MRHRLTQSLTAISQLLVGVALTMAAPVAVRAQKADPPAVEPAGAESLKAERRKAERIRRNRERWKAMSPDERRRIVERYRQLQSLPEKARSNTLVVPLLPATKSGTPSPSMSPQPATLKPRWS